MKKSSLKLSALAIAIGSTSLYTPISAHAAALEEVIVTARKTEESSQSVPIAITNFNAEQLQEQSIQEISEFANTTPSLTINQSFGGSNNAVVGIRGQVQTDALMTFDPSVGIYFDDVYLGRSAGALVQMLDVERVEILKGPQGTLYGRNTTGGALKIISKKPEPSGDLSGFVKAGAGNFNSKDIEGGINIPLIDDVLAFRIAGQATKADGFTTTRVGANEVDSNDSDAHSYRAGLLWNIADGTSLLLQGDRSQSDEHGQFVHNIQVGDRGLTAGANTPPFRRIESDGDFYTGFTDKLPYATSVIKGYSATLDHEINTDLALKVVGAHRTTYNTYAQDSDGSIGGSAGSDVTEDAYQDSIELQFTGTALDDALDWTAGAFWFKEHGYDQTVAVNQIRYLGEATNSSHSAFVNSTYKLTDDLSLTAGVRYTKDTKELVGKNRSLSPANAIFTQCLYTAAGYLGADNPTSPECSLDLEKNFYNLSWTFGVDYKITEDVLVYAKSGTGYRSGGFPLRGADTETLQPFDEEQILDFEVGVKGDYFDRRVRLNVDYYHTEYDDKQDTFAKTVSGFPATGVKNSGSAKYDGLEMELTGAVTDEFTVNATASYIHINVDKDKNELYETEVSNTPEVQYSLSGTYKLPVAYGEWLFRADYTWRDEIYPASANENAEKIDSVGLVNARIALTLDAYGVEVAAWGKNLTDEEYYAGGFFRSSSSTTAAAPNNTTTGWVGAPRTFGVEVSKKF